MLEFTTNDGLSVEIRPVRLEDALSVRARKTMYELTCFHGFPSPCFVSKKKENIFDML